MKKFFILIAISISMAFQLEAQKVPEITEKSLSNSKGGKSAFVVDYENTDEKTVHNEFTKIIKRYKGKIRKNKEEYFADDVLIKELSDNTVDIYARIDHSKGSNSTQLITWFDLGGGYVNSKDYPDQTKAINSILQKTSLNIGGAMALKRVESEQGNLKVLEKDLSDLERDKSNYEKKIAEAEKTIEEMRSKINENIEAQTLKNREIEEQNKLLGKMNKEFESYNFKKN